MPPISTETTDEVSMRSPWALTVTSKPLTFQKRVFSRTRASWGARTKIWMRSSSVSGSIS